MAVVSSRSKTPFGPWEHSPYNPIIHTWSKKETWWSQGHGTLIDAADGCWWMMYHGYEKGYHTLGRQTLLMPICWTEDGWFRVPEGVRPDEPIRKPTGERVQGVLALSDAFRNGKMGLQWRFYGEHDPSRYSFDFRGLILNGKGICLGDTSPLLCIPVNHSYEVTAQITLEGEIEGGFTIFYSPRCYCGVGYNG